MQVLTNLQPLIATREQGRGSCLRDPQRFLGLKATVPLHPHISCWQSPCSSGQVLGTDADAQVVLPIYSAVTHVQSACCCADGASKPCTHHLRCPVSRCVVWRCWAIMHQCRGARQMSGQRTYGLPWAYRLCMPQQSSSLLVPARTWMLYCSNVSDLQLLAHRLPIAECRLFTCRRLHA